MLDISIPQEVAINLDKTPHYSVYLRLRAAGVVAVP